MRLRYALILSLLLTGLILLSLTFPAAASPVPQAYYQTPTAGTDGRIIYIVKQNDTCISISLLNNVPLDTLRQLNKIEGTNCLLLVGQTILLGVVEEPTATPGPTPTATPILPSPTPFNGSGEICILLYNDVNGNGMAETGENPLAGGAISISDRAGKVSLTGSSSAAADPVCFADIPEGDYNVSVAIPEGYNPTTNNNYPLKLQAGDRTVLDFGAQISARALPIPVEEGGRSPLLGILGGLLVLAGIGLGIFMFVLKR